MKKIPEGLKNVPRIVVEAVGRVLKQERSKPAKINYGEYFSTPEHGSKTRTEPIPRNWAELVPNDREALRILLTDAGIDLALWGSEVDRLLKKLLAEITNGDCSLQELQSGFMPLTRFTYRLEINISGFGLITIPGRAGLPDVELLQKIKEVVVEKTSDSTDLTHMQIKFRGYGTAEQYYDKKYPGLQNLWYFYRFDVEL